MDHTNTFRFDQAPFHHVVIKDRKTVELTGVKNIESFDATEFLIETSLGFLNLTGSELTLVKFDQEQAEVSIKGNITSLSYVASKKGPAPKEKFLGKLLK
ncbi:Spore protein YabP [Clostridiales bacterium CHKCI006]|nr:Spore protein YabP [Clostridiales bacterium CHKCI006]